MKILWLRKSPVWFISLHLADMWRYYGLLLAQIWQTGAVHPSAIIPCHMWARSSFQMCPDVGRIWADIMLLSGISFESHAITVTAPIKLQIVVIYPGQILATFLEELDGLLSSFMEDGTPLLVFGDFNIHLDRPYATDFHSLLASFDLKRLTTTSTHKSGNQLDLIYTRNCTTDNILVQPLHISDHFFITLLYICYPDATISLTCYFQT